MTNGDSTIRRLVQSVRSRMSMLFREIAKFGVVGAASFVIDVGMFNLLQYGGPFAVFADQPLRAKIVSVAIATTFAYFGNRFWTFRHRGRTNMGREYVMFFVLNGIAMLIAVTVLGVSHYVLGLTSPLADNISANVVGLILGTLFRFWSYRKWVFPAIANDQVAIEVAERDATTPI